MNEPRGRKGFAPLANVGRLMALIDQCQNRDLGLPGMGCFYGTSGRGKTQAAIHASISKLNVCHIEALPIGGVGKLLKLIAGELGLRPARKGDELFDQVGQALAEQGRPLLIDEADFVLRRMQMDAIRKLHDISGVPVILIGEEQLPEKLQFFTQLHRRILNWVEAEPATLSDVGHLAAVYAEGVEIAPDLQAAILTATNASQGYIANNLSNMRNFAMQSGIARLTLAHWAGRAFHTGAPPVRNRAIPIDAVRRRGAA